jgi:hypothetical protein
MTIEDRGGTLIRREPDPFRADELLRQHPTPEVIPEDPAGHAKRCGRCRCTWQLETGLPNPVNEWCRYDGDCGDHRQAYVDAYLEETWRQLRADGFSESELREASGK